MMSFKRILILLSVSRLMAGLLGFNSGSFFVAAVVPETVPEAQTSDVVIDEDGDVFYDALPYFQEPSTETKVEESAAPVTPEPKVSPPTKVEYKSRTVYIPKRKINKAVKQVSSGLVFNKVSGKRDQTDETVTSDESKKSEVTTLPEVELPGMDDYQSVSSEDSIRSKPRKRVTFKDLPTEVEDKLIGEALKMGTFTTFEKPSEKNDSRVVVSDEELSFDVAEPIYENVDQSEPIYENLDFKTYQGETDGLKSYRKYDGIKKSAKSAMDSAAKRVHGAAHKTSKEAGKLAQKVKYASKDVKSHVHGRMNQAKDFIGLAAQETAKESAKFGKKVKNVSKEGYRRVAKSAKETAESASRKVAKAANKTVTSTGKLGEKLKDTAKVALKDIKTTTRVTLHDASETMNAAADKTKRKAAKVGQKIKTKSDDFATGAKKAATFTKARLQGAAHKVSKEAVKLGGNIKTTGTKTKGSVTRYFRNKFGRLVPDELVSRL